MTMTMKCWPLAALSGFLMVVGNARMVLGQTCIGAACPAYTVSSPDLSCSAGGEYSGPLCKLVYYTLTWPDGATTYVNNVKGTGQYDTPQECEECALPRESTEQCWPAFNTPMASNGSWSEYVYNEQADENIRYCNGDACINEPYIASITCVKTTFQYYHTTGTCSSSASLSPRPSLPEEACATEIAADPRHIPQSPGGIQRLEKRYQVFRTAVNEGFPKDNPATLGYPQDQRGQSEGAREYSGAPLTSAQNSDRRSDDFCPMNYERSSLKPGAAQQHKHGRRLSKQM